jgi:acetylornithine deacetylase
MPDPFARGPLVERLAALMSADTTTGREDAGLDVLERTLRDAGATVERLPVAPGRTNVLARFGAPARVLFTTHLDTVPPYLPPKVENACVLGRGACDAKGQIVAQLAAIESLVADGRRDVAWLGVVGEEADSVGAKAMERLAAASPPPFPELRVVINGEPTKNVLGSGQRGICHLRLRCRGVAAHSGTPERGRSAAFDLLDWLQGLRGAPLAAHAELGPEVWNLGKLAGGRAINVVPDEAEAELLLRQVPGSRFVDAVRALAPRDATVEILGETPPDVFPDVAGYPRVRLPFGSDAPRLRKLCPADAVVLVGPGDIELAHSVRERIDVAELVDGARLLRGLALRFLESAS